MARRYRMLAVVRVQWASCTKQDPALTVMFSKLFSSSGLCCWFTSIGMQALFDLSSLERPVSLGSSRRPSDCQDSGALGVRLRSAVELSLAATDPPPAATPPCQAVARPKQPALP